MNDDISGFWPSQDEYLIPKKKFNCWFLLKSKPSVSNSTIQEKYGK